MGVLYGAKEYCRLCVKAICDGIMSYKIRAGRNFRCKKKVCQKEIGFRVGTFFEGSHLSLKEVSSHSKPLSLFQLNIFDSRSLNSLIFGVWVLLESDIFNSKWQGMTVQPSG